MEFNRYMVYGREEKEKQKKQKKEENPKKQEKEENPKKQENPNPKQNEIYKINISLK